MDQDTVETPQEAPEEAAEVEETEETTEAEESPQRDLFGDQPDPEPEEEAPPEGEAEEPPPEEEKAEEEAEEKPPEPQVHRFRVDGREVEATTEELIQGYQLAESSRRRLQEAAYLTKGARQVIDRVAKDPFGTAEQLLVGMLGSAEQAELQIKDLVIRKAVEFLEEDALPEEARAARKLQKELEATRAKLNAINAKETERAQREAEQEALQSADEEIAQAFETAGLEPTPENFDEVFRLMVRHIDAGVELTAAQAARKVQEKISSKTKKLPKLTPEELEKLDPDLLKSIREYDLKRMRARQLQPSGGRNGPATGRPLQPASPRRDGAKKAPLDWNTFFDPDRE